MGNSDYSSRCDLKEPLLTSVHSLRTNIRTFAGHYGGEKGGKKKRSGARKRKEKKGRRLLRDEKENRQNRLLASLLPSKKEKKVRERGRGKISFSHSLTLFRPSMPPLFLEASALRPRANNAVRPSSTTASALTSSRDRRRIPFFSGRGPHGARTRSTEQSIDARPPPLRPVTSSFRLSTPAAAAASSSPASPRDDNSSSSRGPKSNLLSTLYSSLSRSNDALPLAVVAAALLALLHPQLFAFFKPQHYPLALGFLSFSIGLSLDPSSFAVAVSRDGGRSFGAGLLLQFLVKPLMETVIAKTVVPLLGLPSAVGTGIVLCSIVSGAQLSNYATFLAAPRLAPLSVLLTSTSTALGSLSTPLLALVLLRTRLPPFNPVAVASSLAQVVVLPIAAGISAQRLLPSKVIAACKPGLSFCALLDTCACVGASLASNSGFLLSGGGGGNSSSSSSTAALILVAVLSFHGLCSLLGWGLASLVVACSSGGRSEGEKAEEKEREEARGLGRCLALQGGMQSSLLALLLAHSCFGGDPLVSAAAGVSTAAMTIFGFMLVVFWKWRDSSREG